MLPVGNRAGVTVDKAEKGVVSRRDITLTDLPGIYSLSPKSTEEKITVDYLESGDYDVIINVCDGSALKRSLLLTVDLLSLGKPVIVAVNSFDRLAASGIKIDKKALSDLLKTPIIFTSAKTGKGLSELIDLTQKKYTQRTKFAPITSMRAKVRLVSEVYNTSVKVDKKVTFGDRLDDIVLNKYLAIPIFALVMLFVYYFSLGGLTGYAQGFLDRAVKQLATATERLFIDKGVSQITSSLITNGIIKGVGVVATFIPQLFAIHFCLNLLERCGYLTRVAFIFDGVMQKIGLSGKSVVPFIIGVGCSVPAILSARTIENKRQRTVTAILAPFTPCSAKLPVIAMVTAHFYGANAPFVALSFYVIAIALIVGGAALLNKTNASEGRGAFLYELTDYRMPEFSAAIKDSFVKVGSFLYRVGTSVLICSVLTWALSSFTPRLEFTSILDESLLAQIGKLIAPVLYPVFGANSWQLSVCFLEGLIAKEQVVSALNVLYSSSGALSPFSADNLSFMNGATAYAFVCLNLFSPPCISAVMTLKNEVGKKRTALTFAAQIAFSILFSTAIRLILSIFSGELSN